MNKSLMSNEKVCFVCKTTFNLHKHHIFGGANRTKSDKDGCWCWLCASHHNMSNQGVHLNREADLRLKRICEMRWIKANNKTEEDFIKKYGRSYL